MTDDVPAKLARFTPAAVDRDELLFRAGRASARTPWGWKAAVAVLAVGNAVTLVAWPRPAAPPAPQPAAAPAVPEFEPPPSPPADPMSYLALSRRWDAAAPSAVADPGGPAPRPLRAGDRDELY